MKNIVCKNSWKSTQCCNGINEEFIHGIQIVNGSKVLQEYLFPFQVKLSTGLIHFFKDGVETTFPLGELEETRDEVKQIIKSCAIGTYGSPMQRRTTGPLVVDTDPLKVVDLSPYLQEGDSIAGIYDVYSPGYVNEGLLPEDYTVLLNGNIEFNTEIPVEPEPYVITINFWVTQ